MSDHEDAINFIEQWTEQQIKLKKQLITEDTEIWQKDRKLTLAGGLDLSFSKTDPSKACCTLVIYRLSDNSVVYEDSLEVVLSTPYIPGFLAFREVEPCITLFNKLVNQHPQWIPDVVLLDGNGILHPRGLGLASHFGVCAKVCTVGVAKNLYQMNELLRNDDHKSQILSLKDQGNYFFLKDNSGITLGAALKTTNQAKNPVYISVGHKICLSTAIWTVMQCVSKYRIPEPIRQADLRSRRFLLEKF